MKKKKVINGLWFKEPPNKISFYECTKKRSAKEEFFSVHWKFPNGLFLL